MSKTLNNKITKNKTKILKKHRNMSKSGDSQFSSKQCRYLQILRKTIGEDKFIFPNDRWQIKYINTM